MGRNLSELLSKSLPSAQQDLLQRIAGEASARRYPLYLVGGFVRDLPKFGTAKINIREWRIGRNPPPDFNSHNPPLSSIDLITARSEMYKHSAALPSVKMGTLADDLRRRDFSINTLAIRLDGAFFGELRDDLGGLADLEQGIIRVLHSHSFLDDPTRMYRAVRYEQRFGFQIKPETLGLVPEARSLIDRLSPQRIRHELELTLEESNVPAVLTRLAELDLLKPIHAALSVDQDSLRRLSQVPMMPPYSVPKLTRSNLGWIIWLMPNAEKQIESLNRRLHFTAPLYEALLAACKIFGELPKLAGGKPSQHVERLDRFPLLAVYAVYVAAPDGRPRQALENYLLDWRHVMPKTTGHELKAIGIKPGPRYQEILSRLREAWLDGEVSSETQESSLLQSLL